MSAPTTRLPASQSRPPLVLLHGWAMSPAVWAELGSLVCSTAIITPALPGHAGPRSPAPAGLDAWADAIAEQIPDGAALGGWSLGAMLALEIARRHPHKVSRLLLVGATPRFVARPDWPCGLAAGTVTAFAQGFAVSPAATLKRFLALQCLGDARRSTLQTRLAESLSPAAARGDEAVAEGLRLLTSVDLRQCLGRIDMPCCLLHGMGDALMPIEAARWLANALPHARLHELPDCGHAPFLSQPGVCAGLIEDFLDD